jgi:hypothetical protein
VTILLVEAKCKIEERVLNWNVLRPSSLRINNSFRRAFAPQSSLVSLPLRTLDSILKLVSSSRTVYSRGVPTFALSTQPNDDDAGTRQVHQRTDISINDRPSWDYSERTLDGRTKVASQMIPCCSRSQTSRTMSCTLNPSKLPLY